MKRHYFLWLLILLCVLTWGIVAHAENDADSRALFAKANELSMKGENENALPLYEQLLQRVPNDPDLLYNAGTTNLKAGQLGRAILYMERALSLRPDFDDCLHNLQEARELQKDRVIGQASDQRDTSISLDSVMNGMQTDTLAIVFLVFFLPLLFLLALRRWIRSERGRFGLMLANLILLVAVLVSGSLLTLKVQGYEAHRYAVVLSEETVVHEGPNLNYPDAFTVHEGLKLRLGEQVEDWRQVWLENGLNGYLPEKDLGAI